MGYKKIKDIAFLLLFWFSTEFSVEVDSAPNPHPQYPQQGGYGDGGMQPAYGQPAYPAYGQPAYQPYGAPPQGQQYQVIPPQPLPGQPLYADVQYFPSQPPDSGVGILGGALSGLGGIACGIMSILASCADERAFHHAMPIGMAAQEGWNKNTWQMKTLMDGRRKRRDISMLQNRDRRNDLPEWVSHHEAPKTANC